MQAIVLAVAQICAEPTEPVDDDPSDQYTTEFAARFAEFDALLAAKAEKVEATRSSATEKRQTVQAEVARRLFLPGDWEEKADPASGKKYYVNHRTKQTQWDRPPADPSESPPPPDWMVPPAAGFPGPPPAAGT